MIYKTVLITALTATLATGAFAKGHDQGRTDAPGTTAADTAAAAKTLGGSQGNRPENRGPLAE
ncbi:hypothetical protein OAH97_00455 [Octadecabacter sp.]|nr:hypothetical protein [Octadecabacter sp.]